MKGVGIEKFVIEKCNSADYVTELIETFQKDNNDFEMLDSDEDLDNLEFDENEKPEDIFKKI